MELLEKYRKRTAKDTPKIEKNVKYLRKYLFCLQSNASCSFLQTSINFVKQRFKFSHFESSLIPLKTKRIILTNLKDLLFLKN